MNSFGRLHSNLTSIGPCTALQGRTCVPSDAPCVRFFTARLSGRVSREAGIASKGMRCDALLRLALCVVAVTVSLTAHPSEQTRNAHISEDGLFVTFEMDGLYGSEITGFAGGKAAFLDVESRGFEGEQLVSAPRTIPLRFVQVEGLGGDFADDFLGTAGTRLDEHEPEHDISGAGWRNDSGSWGIAQGGTPGRNAAPFSLGPDGRAIATCSVGSPDGSIKVLSIARPTNRAAGLVFRLSAVGQFWSVTINDAQQRIVLERYQNGNPIVVGSRQITDYSRDSAYTIEVRLAGPSIRVLLDGEAVFDHESDWNADADRHGLMSAQSTSWRVFGGFRINEIQGFQATLALGDPVYAFDTAAALTLPDGLFLGRDGGSAPVEALPVASSSQRPADPAIGGLVGVIPEDASEILVDRSVVEGMVTAEAQFAHWAGIGGVLFRVSDGTHSVSTVATERRRSRYRDSALVSEAEFSRNGGGRFYYQADFDLSLFQDGPLELSVFGFPAIADEGGVLQEDWTLFNNASRTLGAVMHAASPTGGWNWTAASQYGGSDGSPPTIYVHREDGSDATGLGTASSPYRTLGMAVSRLVALDVGSWGQVVLMHPGLYPVERLSNTMRYFDCWMRITGAVSGVELTYDEANPAYPHIEFVRGGFGVKLKRVTLNLDHGVSRNSLWLAEGTLLRDSRGHWHSGHGGSTWIESSRRIYANDPGAFLGVGYAEQHGLDAESVVVHGGGTGIIPGVYTIVDWDREEGDWIQLEESITGGMGDAEPVGWGRGRRLIMALHEANRRLFVTGAEISHLRSGPSRATLARNIRSRGISLDWMQEPRLVIACRIDDFFGAHSASGHADIIQLVAAARNVMIDGVHAETDSETQLFFFENAPATMGGGGLHANWAIMNSVFSRTVADPTAAPFSQLNRPNHNVVFENNTILGQRLVMRTGDANQFVPAGARFHNNVFQILSFGEVSNRHARFSNNHYIGGNAVPQDAYASQGGTLNDVVRDAAAGDFSPTGAALNRVTSSMFEGDLYGRRIRTDGTGAIGAIQPMPEVGDADLPVPPTAGVLHAVPGHVGPGALALHYDGVVAGTAPVAEVRLWARAGQGAWQPTEAASSSLAGTLVFDGLAAEGVYRFALVATDTDGLSSPEPAGAGMAMTVLDTTPPNPGDLTVEPYFTAPPLVVAYAGATDGDGSGLSEVRLWARAGDGDWGYTGLSSAFAADQFLFPAPSGSGAYRFALQAVDWVGNASPVPSGAGQGGTVLDMGAPEAGVLSGPATANAVPVALSYAGASDTHSGLAEVRLWARVPGGAWQPTDFVSADPAGAFAFAPLPHQGEYHFALVATDAAGNRSALPTGPGALTVLFGDIPPAVLGVSAPPYANAGPVTVSYTAEESVTEAALWVRTPAGAWSGTGQVAAGPAGAFAFDGFAAEGVHGFAVVVSDALGNASAAPSGSGLASTHYDTAAPGTGTVTAPAQASTTPIAVLFAGVSDGAGSGVAEVALWARLDDGPWSDTGLRAPGTAGDFAFEPATGDGTYGFALVATDRAGNASATPAGTAAAQTVLDTRFTAGRLAAPAYATESPIALAYSGARGGEDAETVTVHLWVRAGAEGTWQEAGVSATGPEGTLPFDGLAGDGRYHFALQAENEAGARTEAPHGTGQRTVFYDTTPPAGVLTSPAYARSLPVTLAYEATDGDGSGVAAVHLWVRQGDDGAWEDTGLVLTESEGTVSYDAIDQDAVYYFAIEVVDAAGLRSGEPDDALVAALLAALDDD